MQRVNTIAIKIFFLLLLVSFLNTSLLNIKVQASTTNFKYVLEFSDDGKLTLTAGKVPLGFLLEDIQKKTDLKLKIHKDHVERPISVNFESLPLEQAIKRILKGINYICLFRSNQKVEKIITISSPPRKSLLSRNNLAQQPPPTMSKKVMPPPEIQDMEIAMGITTPQEVEYIETAMETKPPPATEDMEMVMRIIPPPENLQILEVMEIEPLSE